jgi:hypothetical protein
MSHDEGFGGAYVSPDPEYASTPPGAGYEHTDANVWIIVKFGLWLAVTAAIIHVGLLVMFRLFVEQRETAVPQYPLATDTGLQLPAQPRLQRFPANEAFDLRRQEAAALGTYGWVDRNAGTVRLPIDEAMRLTVERGLPVRAPAAPAAAATADTAGTAAPAAAPEVPGLMPADSSSGRTMERRRQ